MHNQFSPDPPTGPLHVLVVESDDNLRDVVAKALGSRGHHVIAAEDARQAWAEAQALPRLDLLLADVYMPYLNGRELGRLLGAMRPGLKVLLTSGYPQDYLIGQGILEPDADFLEKPFSLRLLLERVEAAAKGRSFLEMAYH